MKYNKSRFYANKPAPLLNNYDFKSLFGKNFNLDKDGLFRPCELIALPGTGLELLEDGPICTVRLASYSDQPLYTDRRFLCDQPAEQPEMPPAQEILARLDAAMGLPYIWGGNYGAGISEMLEYYPPPKELSDLERTSWTFAGVDCSGLLFEACNGLTPRNSSQLLHFGKAVSDLKPLDLIVWDGHVVIVYDEQTTIESRLGHGVIKTPLTARLDEIRTSQTKFTIRRFI